MKTKLVLFFSLFIFGCTLPQSLRKTEWTVPEVKEWVNKNEKYSTWKGLLLYRGSDTARHHFISRVMDEFVWFDIKRAELVVPEEKPYSTQSSAPLGYYYVDPKQDFVRVKDYDH
ncbi:MAG: hypothetical protein FD123_2495 [Bacteroidetes bacterium]|nr:MAG: hypothetical protein FD123_2495 [Bacteroidota bacterium]